ncbi:MAG TPA: cell division protein FtsZ [Solirubrobacteraceae bacterium]|nr:cell division protein FtsZ [Solirubrobacteraceae bacterium]
MSSHKRASMREGPLAALFRRTEDDEQAGQAQDPSEYEQETAALARDTADTPGGDPAADPGASADAEKSGAAPDARAQGAEARSAGSEARSASREYRSAGTETRSAAAGARGPASRAPARAAEPATPAGAIRAPKDRLKQAFSSDIPASLMDSDRHAGGSPRPAVEYADERAAFGPTPDGQPIIRVVGVGGAGVNAVNRMVQAEVEGVEFLAINTDQQSLQHSTADITLHIGAALTRGLGSGSDAAVGRQAAMEDYDRTKALLKGSDMIFITAGAGGGTGSGAAPIIARIAGEVGALTVAIVTKPFSFEGSRRSEQAEKGVAALAEEVDTLIVVPNDRLLSVLDKQTAMVEAFRVADDVLRQGVQGISDLVTLPGLINLDFADVRTIMSDAGSALLGIGMGAGGEQRAIEAASQAVASPLLETSMDGARSILLSITGGRDLSLWEVNEAAKAVSEAAHPDANIIFGAMIDEKLDDQVWVTVVATGYSDAKRVIARDAGDLREPAGEPRVRRTAAARPRSGRRASLSVEDLDVPEFMPR